MATRMTRQNGTEATMPCNARPECRHRKHGWRKRKALGRSTKSPPTKTLGWPLSW